MTDTTTTTQTTDKSDADPAGAKGGNLFDAGDTSSNGSHLATLVGEGRQYRTAEDLAKAVKDKETFITQLKTENAQMREAVKGTKNTDEIVQTILAKLNGAGGDTTTTTTTSDDTTRPAPKQLDPYDIAELISQKMEQKSRASTEAANEASAQGELVKALGSFDKAKVATAEKAKALGMNVADLQAVARKSPSAFLGLMGVAAGGGTSNGPDLSRIQNVPQDPTGKVRNEAYYSALRREVGNGKFFKPEIQNQLMKDKVALGEKW